MVLALSPPASWGKSPNSTTIAKMAKRRDLDILLTAGEVAQLLRTTRRAVYSRVQRGEIPGVVRVGRSLRFQRAAVLQWLRACGPLE